MACEYKSMLVLLLAGAGDTLLTTPMLGELKAAFPDADVDVLVMQGPSSCEVLEGNAAINRLHYHHFMKESFSASVKKCLALRKLDYDCVIVPMPHNRLVYNLIAFLIGGRERIGFEYEIKCGSMGRPFFHRSIKENNSLHLAENNLRIITEGFGKELVKKEHKLELKIKEKNVAFAKDFLSKFGMGEGDVIAVHPGSGITKNLHLKRWAAEKWAGLIREISGRCGGILVLGGPEEESLKQNIIALSGLDSKSIVSVDEGTVLDMAALILKCKCVVSCDTLVPHVAAAVGTPVAVVYGPTSHVAAYPYGVRYELVWTGIDCSPCYGFSRYGIKCTNDVYLKCLKDIKVDDVMDAVEELLV